eukprot:TRINITY_DN51309_c0_g1_i1.p2 TRINITY_DN51309_c0_g1~~TRINITY_DN51309_c0_g1_i1.p2  ORF type:complete len:174 (-),score=18.18 TRINITY_DN51309_c0_g1_i1:33-554(-)
MKLSLLACAVPEKKVFGIIEREMYLEAYGRDPTTPTAHVQMIGVFHPGEVHNMKAETSTNLIYGARYVVKCNLVDHLVTIKGPGLSLYANLVPGVSYTPCFSCGCTSNQFKIRPLVSFDELDQLTYHISVSYTHLTLPTILLVQISVVAVSLKKKKKEKNQRPISSETQTKPM